MVPKQHVLGDSHNFGRRVALRGDRVLKPRTVMWEWLMLSADSPLRQLIATKAEQDGMGDDAFAFLPDLEFSQSADGLSGEVESVKLETLGELDASGRLRLARITGRSMALWSWFGVSDLHWENLVLGVNTRGHVVFAPLDIEIILADLSLPTETKLLPDADPDYAEICRHACGVRRVLPYLGKPVDPTDLVAMAAAYLSTLEFLDRHGRAIAQVLSGLPAMTRTPIRVLLRGTDEYVLAGKRKVWPPFLQAEQEQMARGDIPYFFRLYGRQGIHYFGNAELTMIKTLPLKGDVPQLDPILQLSRGLRSPARDSLREKGLFALLAAFDSPSFSGRYRDEELEVRFGARSIVVKAPDGDEMRTKRDLSAFVGSVYLPCHCGEVRSVFVPSVTVCEAAR